MNLRRITTRTVVAGATAALAAGGLVGITTAAAHAAPVTPITYDCSVGGRILPIQVTPTGALPSRLTAGDEVAANVDTLSMEFTVPRAVLDGLAAFNVTQVGLSTSNFAYGIGPTSVPVTGLSAAKTSVPDSGDLVLPVSGKNGAFTAPVAGTYDLTMPAAFNAVVSTNAAPPLASLPAACTIHDAATAVIGSVDVVAGPQGAAYSCTVAGNAVPLFVDPTTVPDFGSPASGSTVPAEAQPVGVNYTVPAAVASGLPASTVAVSSEDFALRLADATSIPVTGLGSEPAPIVPGNDVVLPAEGTNGAFLAPAPGTYDLKLPATFTATVTTDTLPPLTGSCAIVDEASSVIGSLTVAPAPKQSSTTTATAPKSVKKGASVKISVTVKTAAPATGQVTAKEGSKSLGNASIKNGKATITVKGLKPGKHTIKVVYAGDSTTTGSTSKAVTVTVKK